MEEKTERQNDESRLTVRIGVVVVLVIGFFGWVFSSTMMHEGRITKLETQLEIHIPKINSSLDGLNKITTEIRDDQLRRQRKEPQ